MPAGGHWPDPCQCHCRVAALEWFSLRVSCTPQPCGCYPTQVHIPAPWQACLPDPWEEKPPPCGSSTLGYPERSSNAGSRMSIPGAMSHLVPFPATLGSQPCAHPTPCLFPLPIFARRCQRAVMKLKASNWCDAPNPREALERCLHLACWEGGKLPPLPARPPPPPPPWLSLPGGKAGLVCFPWECQDHMEHKLGYH